MVKIEIDIQEAEYEIIKDCGKDGYFGRRPNSASSKPRACRNDHFASEIGKSWELADLLFLAAFSNYDGRTNVHCFCSWLQLMLKGSSIHVCSSENRLPHLFRLAWFRSSNTCSVFPFRVALSICADRHSTLTSFWLPTRIQLPGKALLHVYRVQSYLQILVFLRPTILFILINILGLEPSTHSSVSITISFGKSFATTIFLWIEDTNFCFISESLPLLIRSTILFYFPFGQTNNIAKKLFK